jgi:hypothetical protein
MTKLIVAFHSIANVPKNLYARNDFKQMPIHTSSTRFNALHDLTLNEMIVARFVGTGNFSIR